MILTNLESKEANREREMQEIQEMQDMNNTHNSHHHSHRRERSKLSFLFTSQQFSKFVEEQFPESLSYKHKHTEKNIFDKLEDITHTLYFSELLDFILSTKGRYKKQFQRFLQNKCMSLLNIPVIDLDNLKETCNTKEAQIILLISMVYYFS